ncbi:MAG: YceI family protein [Flavobacteriales bacterium]|nr:YceI family protein [Flavobacteriales bacterium]
METATAVKTTWAIDPTHSEVQFKVKHLVISTVTGFFRSFEGSVRSESEDFDGAEVSFKLDVDSIDTNQSDRDGHLKSDDFFAAEKYPQITFDNGILSKDGDKYVLKGDLTIRDITKPVSMTAELGGIMEDPYGNTKAGFEVNGKVNRKEFGLMWDTITEAGGVVVGDDVRLHFNIQVARG